MWITTVPNNNKTDVRLLEGECFTFVFGAIIVSRSQTRRWREVGVWGGLERSCWDCILYFLFCFKLITWIGSDDSFPQWGHWQPKKKKFQPYPTYYLFFCCPYTHDRNFTPLPIFSKKISNRQEVIRYIPCRDKGRNNVFLLKGTPDCALRIVGVKLRVHILSVYCEIERGSESLIDLSCFPYQNL